MTMAATAPAAPAPINTQAHAGRPESSLSDVLCAAFAAAATAAAAAGAWLVEVVVVALGAGAVAVSVLTTVVVCAGVVTVDVFAGAVVVVCVTVFVCGAAFEFEGDVVDADLDAADAVSPAAAVAGSLDVPVAVPVLAVSLWVSAAVRAWLTLFATEDAPPEPHAAKPTITELTAPAHTSLRTADRRRSGGEGLAADFFGATLAACMAIGQSARVPLVVLGKPAFKQVRVRSLWRPRRTCVTRIA
jgi:hypothetical protein